MFDIIVIGDIDNLLLKQYPFIKKAKDFYEAQSISVTRMFWIIWDYILVDEDFDFSYAPPEYDEKYVHIFSIKDSNLPGICLFPKSLHVSKKELEYNFFANSKKIDKISAVIKPFFDIFYITDKNYPSFNYSFFNKVNNFKEAQSLAKTKMFWVIWEDIIVDKDFDFSFVPPDYDEKYTHIFSTKDSDRRGICLFPKDAYVSEKELTYRFFSNSKKIDKISAVIKPFFDIIVISNSSHPSYTLLRQKYPFIKKVNNFKEAQSLAKTKMFWVIWEDIIVDKDFDFSFVPPDYDEKYTHTFLVKDSNLTGMCLFPKDAYVSEKELKYRFFSNSKKIDTVTSSIRLYDIFYPDSYEDYLRIFNTESTTDMYWIVHPSLEVSKDFKFDYLIDENNIYEKNLIHVFLNRDIDTDTFDGILLCSKNIKLEENEFETRILIHKKEHPILASSNKPYDIFLISYYDELADKKFELLKEKFPRAIHIKNIHGIHEAHKTAAEMSSTPMFWVIDSDARILDNFKFDLQVPRYNHNSVFVWHSKNPVNGLEYGYGAVKLLPKFLTMKVETSIDMTTTISKSFYVIEEISNYTDFNTDEFNSWKSAFRECVKLTLKSSEDNESAERLKIWCTVGKDNKFGKFVIDGANQGKKYAEDNADDLPALSKINDFNWLKDQFNLRLEIIGNTIDITSAQALATS